MSGNGRTDQPVANTIPFARSYQLEALELSLKQNTIVFFETGTGKTLISIMLLRSYAHFFRKPSPYFAVFLVPTVVLVTQQAESISMHTDLKVGKYYGDVGVDFWDAEVWKDEKDKYEVFVMTPQVLLDALRHSFLMFDHIKVLIFDECHNSKGSHPYACIMREYYHRELSSNNLQLPRVFGMTASPIKAKAKSSAEAYWEQIRELENLMNAKVFTCDSVSVLAEHISFCTPKLKMYKRNNIPQATFSQLENDLKKLIQTHEDSLSGARISESVAESAKKRLRNLLSTFMFCLEELGIWLALKAAEIFSHKEKDTFKWSKVDVSGERVVKAFCSDVSKVFSSAMPFCPEWSIRNNLIANMAAGYLSSKVTCLVDILHEYREVRDLRCIVFVERIVTAMIISSLLNELLQETVGWRAEYTAGNGSQLHSQSRKEQNAIISQFRQGTVNIIIATSMLEEGLDVQSCNLVIRFDPSATVCSFIQSRGRARMPNSDFILMVESGDDIALARVQNYLVSGDIMRNESLRHSNIPCEPLDVEMYGDEKYQVESTGAIVTLSSSVQLLYFYCARLPSDRYFKPYPRFIIDKDLRVCTLHLPNNCPIQTIKISGDIKLVKKLACLEACKQLHKIGALTDNLVPDILLEETEVEESGYKPYFHEHATFSPPEVVSSCSVNPERKYHCYLIELQRDFEYDVKLQNVILAVHSKLESDIEMVEFDLDADRGKVFVRLKYCGHAMMNAEKVFHCRRFQITLFRILLDHNLNKLREFLDQVSDKNSCSVFDYLLLPSLTPYEKIAIDWRTVIAARDVSLDLNKHIDCVSGRGCGNYVNTRNGLVPCPMLENALVCTPHNGFLYCISGFLDGFNGNTCLELSSGESLTYKQYYKTKHGINLQYEKQNLLRGKRVFTVHNYLQRCRPPRVKEPSNQSYELPPEICVIVISPISVSTFYSFSFLPSIIHRIQSLLLASNLKHMHADQSIKNADIPTMTILEAITTKKCQEKIHLESLETLGDSFLKYASTQQLFKEYQNQHEGILSLKRQRIISNASLCKLGCERLITGFIRDEPFEPHKWIIPGVVSKDTVLQEQMLGSRKIYHGTHRKLKSKRVADVVEALIGAYLSAGGELAALTFMKWIGIRVDFLNVPYTRDFVVNPKVHVNLRDLESLLNYSFKDGSLLVEALTHGSYMLPEIPRCYQRLEFLGDAVLDYLVTVHLYQNYPGLSPGLLTDLRSASVNNDCYAQAAIKKELYKHILHTSQELNKQIAACVYNFDELSLSSTFNWESETTFPKVLGDVIESLAGAIFVDSGCNKDIVFQSIRPLLEPLITPETMKIHPCRELNEFCSKKHYVQKTTVTKEKGVAYVTVEVEADGIMHKNSSSGSDKKTANKLACKAVLESLKESESAMQLN